MIFNRKESKQKDRITKLGSDIKVEDLYLYDDLGYIPTDPGFNPDEDTEQFQWSFALLGCGSNSFGQLSSCISDLILSSFKEIKLYQSQDNLNQIIENCQISCGSNMSVLAFVNKTSHGEKTTKIYNWGSGISKITDKIPLSIPPTLEITKVSCGESHAGFITKDGKAFTWGTGENGALGHGNKLSLQSPKMVESLLSPLHCTDISCGAFHTAIIADDIEKISHIYKPAIHSTQGPGSSEVLSGPSEYFTTGNLYTFGVGKAGQLGLERISSGSSSRSKVVFSPKKVDFFENKGLRVVKVSCGLHHTAVIAVPSFSPKVFSSSIYTFGYGEEGRLGNGSENSSSQPIQVEFATPFHPIDIALGDLHCLASGKDGCFSWGSNSMGQLGISSPSLTPFATTPQKVPLPEGMVIKQLAAGGRHSAAITHCGKVLTWGWGEEGQLGHGNEKSSYLPRPCRISMVHGVHGVPVDLSLGMSHSLLIVKNPNAAIELVIEEGSKEEEEEEEDEKKKVVAFVDHSDQKHSQTPPEKEEDQPHFEALNKEEEEEISEISPTSENKIESSSELEKEAVADSFVPAPPAYSPRATTPALRVRISSESSIDHQLNLEPSPVQSSVPTAAQNFRFEDEVDPPQLPDPPIPLEYHQAPPVLDAPSVTESDANKKKDAVNIFYKEGQDLDNCLVANSAKRAELRRKKKSQEAISK